jgi:hypothetical protein
MKTKPNAAETAVVEEVNDIVVVETQGAVVDTAIGDLMWEEFAGQGNENVKPSDLQTQYLAIIEGSSDLVKRGSASYNKNAKPGDIVNTVTGDVYSGEDGIIFIPCYYSTEYVTWLNKRVIDRNAVGSPKALAVVKANKRNPPSKPGATGRLTDPDGPEGNEFTETAYHVGFLLRPGSIDVTRVTISMTSTRLKKSKRLNTLIDNARIQVGNPPREVQLPRFGQVYQITVSPETNNSTGDQYYVWEPKFLMPVSDRRLLLKAKEYHEFCVANGVQAPPDESAAPEADGGAGHAPAGQSDDVPF